MTTLEMLQIFLVPWGWPFLAYLVLQVIVSWRTRATSPWIFWLSLLPVIPAIVVLVLTWIGGREENNLWPLYLIFGGVAFAGYQALLLIMSFVTAKAARPAAESPPSP